MKRQRCALPSTQRDEAALLGLAATLALGLSACVVIGHEKVDGWPTLAIVEHHVPHHEMRDRCGKYVPAWASPEACAEFNFAAAECHVWLSADFPPAPGVLEHERLHCAGYDHVGEHAMRAMLVSVQEVQ